MRHTTIIVSLLLLLTQCIKPFDLPAGANNVSGLVVEGNIAHIEVAKVRPNPFQPRADFHQEALDELKQSIAQKGVIQAWKPI